jgi:hypothetical protein
MARQCSHTPTAAAARQAPSSGAPGTFYGTTERDKQNGGTYRKPVKKLKRCSELIFSPEKGTWGDHWPSNIETTTLHQIHSEVKHSEVKHILP